MNRSSKKRSNTSLHALLTHCQASHLSLSKRKLVLNMVLTVLTSVEVFYYVSSFRVNKQALFRETASGGRQVA